MAVLARRKLLQNKELNISNNYIMERRKKQSLSIQIDIRKRPIANILTEDFTLRHTTEFWILSRHLWMKNKIACNILQT